MEQDIVINSFYLINLFQEKKDEIKDTFSLPNNAIIQNLKLSILMLLAEACYMNKYDKEMFNGDWFLWDGMFIQNKKLHDYFKKYGSLEIWLDVCEKAVIDALPPENKEVMKNIYDIFSKYNTFELLTFALAPGSPMHKLMKIAHDNNSTRLKINKEEIKEWFNFLNSGGWLWKKI